MTCAPPTIRQLSDHRTRRIVVVDMIESISRTEPQKRTIVQPYRVPGRLDPSRCLVAKQQTKFACRLIDGVQVKPRLLAVLDLYDGRVARRIPTYLRDQ